METVTTECGSIKINQAIAAAATEATAKPSFRPATAVDATAVCTKPPIWVTKTIASDQEAAFRAGRSPKPRNLKFRFSESPIFFQLANRINA